MKIIVTHKSCDMDAITSVWLIKRYLPGWENAKVAFVVAGEKMQGKYENRGETIEKLNGNEVIHVDTGLGRLDHHQIYDVEVCAASLTLEFILKEGQVSQNEVKREALRRMIDQVLSNDHFQEVFEIKPGLSADDLSIFALIDGMKLRYPGEDGEFVEFGMDCLDSFLHAFENRVWAQSELKEKGIEFETQWGKGIGVETVNDYILELGQKMGYPIVVRKDPKNGFVRIKALPKRRIKPFDKTQGKNSESGIMNEKSKNRKSNSEKPEIDLTLVYEKLKKLDPYATWFLHISKRMLLNGSSKNPNAVGTKLNLLQIIAAIKNG